jgi:pseudouridine synthase
MRLQVFLSRSGVCSRRKALELIKEGYVSVNGKVIVEPSFSVEPEKDRVLFRGKRLRLKKNVYILLNKPKGVTSTCKDKYAECTVIDLLPHSLRHLYPVGRLDKDSEGLLLLTNDGELAYRLTHPKFNINKRYTVEIKGSLRIEDKNKLEKGIILEGKKTSLCQIRIIQKLSNKTRLEVTLHEGRKRQIKKMFSLLGYKVIRLKREGEGPIELGALRKGKWRFLKDREIQNLYQLVGLANQENN